MLLKVGREDRAGHPHLDLVVGGHVETASARSGAHRRQALDRRDAILFSSASIWEIAIKIRTGRSSFNFEPEPILATALATGFVELPVAASVACRVRHLPDHHRDPFDRLLVAQTIAAGATLLTSDAALPPYSPLVRLV